MNTHADKTSENKSKAVANSLLKLQSNGKSTSQFVDNRPEAIAQRKIQEMANNSPQVSQLRSFQGMANNIPQAKQIAQLQSMASNSSVVQRQVPPQGGGTSKEIPYTVYQARGGGDIRFNKNEHPRSHFSFGAHTRNAVFQGFNPQYAGDRIINIRSSSGEQVNVEGIQLDHQTSWDTISNTMDSHNRELGANWNSQKGYSLFDAKMYYNDIDNLVPALGAINASAGELGVNEMPRIHHGLEIYQGNLQTAWMNLQAGLVAVGHGITDENAVRIAGLLHGIYTSMNNVTEEIL